MKREKVRGTTTKTTRCPHCKKQLEGRWERGVKERQCYFCGKEFTLDEMSKLSKKPKSRTKQPPLSGRPGSVPEKGMPSLRVPVHDIRIPEHTADTGDCGSSQEGRRNLRGVIFEKDSKPVKSVKHFCVDPQENLRRVLEARRHG